MNLMALDDLILYGEYKGRERRDASMVGRCLLKEKKDERICYSCRGSFWSLFVEGEE